jgi:hypothetical protein
VAASETTEEEKAMRASISRNSSWLTAALVALSVAPAHGYPIPPSTLWSLATEADLVVLATVEEDGREAHAAKADEADEESFDWTPARAKLAVREVWKGQAGREIVVAYSPNLICPAPARFEEGQTVLAFLGWDADKTLWYVPELSYGTLYPREGEIGIHRRLVEQALFLQRNRLAQNGPPLEWLAEAAAARGTRWHGLYGLAARFDRLHSFYDRESGQYDLSLFLSKAAIERIVNGFVDEPSADVTFVMMLGLLAGEPSESFDRAALGIFEGLLQRESAPYWIADALRLLLERFAEQKIDGRLARLGAEEFSTPAVDEVRKVWSEAKLDLALPDVAPIVPEPDAVWGVGGTTPD